MMTLEEKLCDLRKKKGLSQLDLAEALGVSRQAVSRWERGAALPSMKNLIALSQLYEVEMDFLVNDGAQAQAAAQAPCAVADREPEKSGPPAIMKYILWALCFLAVCVDICITVLTLNGRPKEEEEEEVIPISELEEDEINNSSVEGYADLEDW